MISSKSDIIAQLQKSILPLGGFKRTAKNDNVEACIGPMRFAFPNAQFPIGAIHEFISTNTETAASTDGFIAGVLASIMQNSGISLWISSARNIFPPALTLFGVKPEKIIFIDLKKEKEILWAMEEALTCEGLSAVVGEIQSLSFTASRRLQLAVEKSQVTGFIIRNNPRNLNTTACITRWKIHPLSSELSDGVPGVGFPRWNVELLKVRNGKPGSWQIEFAEERFRYISKIAAIAFESKKKTG